MVRWEIVVKKSSGYKILDRSAVDAVRKWKFAPGREGNTPIKYWVNIPIKFQLNEDRYSQKSYHLSTLLGISSSCSSSSHHGRKRKNSAIPFDHHPSSVYPGREGEGTEAEQASFSPPFPRAILAGLVGAGLSVSGAIFQALLRNPLATLYLGVSGGQAVGAVIAILMGLSFYPTVSLSLIRGSAADGHGRVLFRKTG